MYQDPQTVKIRRTLFAVLIGIALLVGWLIYFAVSTSGTVLVEIKKAPFDAKVSLDGVEVKGESVRLKPGNYIFDVSRDGFYDKKVPIIINEEGFYSASFYLSPETDEAKSLVLDNDKFHYDHALTAGEVFNIALDRLPIKTGVFVVDSTARSENYPSIPLTLDITASKGYRNAAIEAIRDKGLNPSDYLYNFKNYKDPF